MKRCQYCGKEYADGVAVCPADGQPLMNPDRKETTVAAPPETAGRTFNVKLVSPVSSAGKYRVFVERNDLLFIQVEGGASSALATLAPLLGPGGSIITLILWLFTKKKAKDRLQRIETGEPVKLLRDGENNFTLNLAEIRDATVEAPALFQTSGKAGRLIFLVRHGEKIKCEFDDNTEMTKAISLLTEFMNATLRVNVEWNAQKERFIKKKML
jgi:hypothetical protein